jgi:hypothetical protein
MSGGDPRPPRELEPPSREVARPVSGMAVEMTFNSTDRSPVRQHENAL